MTGETTTGPLTPTTARRELTALQDRRRDLLQVTPLSTADKRELAELYEREAVLWPAADLPATIIDTVAAALVRIAVTAAGDAAHLSARTWRGLAERASAREVGES